jgi:hypothetical protein
VPLNAAVYIMIINAAFSENNINDNEIKTATD